MLDLLKNGIAPSTPRRRIALVGGGMAGLMAGYVLYRAGHDVHLFEAGERIGGRVRTLRRPFARGEYAEAGPMRFSTQHELVRACLRRFSIPEAPFIAHDPATIVEANGVRMRRAAYEEDPDRLGFAVEPKERGKTAEELCRDATDRLLGALERPEAWKEFDRHSVASFFRASGYSDGAISMIQTLLHEQGLTDFALLESLRLPSYQDIEYRTVAGGWDRLPQAIGTGLQPCLHLRRRITRVRTRSAEVELWIESRTGVDRTVVDYAILAVPLPALQRITFDPPLSAQKREAIAAVQYVPATKLFLQFERPFWVDEGIRGGVSATDRSVRFVFYPTVVEGRVGASGSSVLVASYTLGRDTLRWRRLGPEKSISLAVKDLEVLHGRTLKDELIGTARAVWGSASPPGGAFPILLPGQETRFGDVLEAPEGRLYFAGEHTSRLHGWVEGALESGLRAARRVAGSAARNSRGRPPDATRGPNTPRSSGAR